MLQILLRITEAVMQKPKESQAKDTFAQSMAGLLFRVSGWGCLLSSAGELGKPLVKEGFLNFC